MGASGVASGATGRAVSAESTRGDAELGCEATGGVALSFAHEDADGGKSASVDLIEIRVTGSGLGSVLEDTRELAHPAHIPIKRR